MEDMEQKNQPAATTLVTPTPEVLVPDTETTESEPATKPAKSATPWIAYGVAVVALIAIAVSVVYLMERDGRLSTGFFVPADGISPNSTIATINGTEIKGSELSTSINQISTSATQQGIDITDPAVQANIKDQAVEMLINTELLRQEAAKREITITDENVTARIDALVTEVGGRELLDTRMAELGIDDKTLRRDVGSELLIQTLLDQVFAESEVTVTKEEIEQVYENAAAVNPEVPPLSEVYAEIEAEIRAEKEQKTLDTLLADLRSAATVEMPE